MSGAHLPRWYRDASAARVPRVRWLVYQRLRQSGPVILGVEDMLPAIAVLEADIPQMIAARYRAASESEIESVLVAERGSVPLRRVWRGVARPLAPGEMRPALVTWGRP